MFTWMMALLFLALRAFNVNVMDFVYRVGDLLPRSERKATRSLDFNRQNTRNNFQSDYSARQYPTDNFQSDYPIRQYSSNDFQSDYSTRQYLEDNLQSTYQSQYSTPKYNRYRNERIADDFTTLNCSGYSNWERSNNFSSRQCGCPCRFRKRYYSSQNRYRSQMRHRSLY